MKDPGMRTSPQLNKPPSDNRASRRLWLKITLSILPLLLIGLLAILWWRWPRPPKPLVEIVTLAIAGRAETPIKAHYEPFGIVADDDGNIFFSESITGRIYKLTPPDYLSKAGRQNEAIVAQQLATPSALALDRAGNLLIANTGAHTIVRVNLKSNETSIVAGADGVSGFADGPAASARFNGPIGIAVAQDGTIFVADTYNDRIRLISPDGQVRTLAGSGEPGFADGTGAEAQFDTPCGIAIAQDRSLLIADTGNRRIRRVDLNGLVSTVAGTGEPGNRDGIPAEATFVEPTAIAVRDKNSFFVADAANSSLRLCTFGEQPSIKIISGGYPNGLIDAELSTARLNRPTGLALLPDGELAFADSGNGLIRACVPLNSKIGHRADPSSVIIQAPEMRALLEPRWPFEPPQTRRDLAGTFGEVRGERLPDHDAWFHSGLDIPGAYGETVHAIFTETVTRPLASSGFGSPRERLRMPLFEYIHLRIGRDQHDQPIGHFANGAITFRRDPQGNIMDIRVRRGTRINAGDPIGTLNRLNHVHLIAGPPAFECNALLVLKLPGLTDTVAPTIEALRLFDEQNHPVFESEKANKLSKPVEVSGKLRITLRAYDQVDGNPRYRRLGVYRLGYQILNADGSPSADFKEPRYNITFNRLPVDPNAVPLAFAEDSQSGYQGVTIFNYIVTNIVRDGEARENFWDTTQLAPGNYTLRVFAEDFFGNQARRDLSVKVNR